MWNDLGMKERADLIGLFLKNGIRSLDEMKRIYNHSFQNGGRKWDSSRAKKERYPTLDLSGIRTTSDRPYNTGYAEYIYHAFQDSLNYTPAQTAAIVGTTIEESGADPFARSENGTYNGLLQWSRDRYVPNPNNVNQRKHARPFVKPGAFQNARHAAGKGCAVGRAGYSVKKHKQPQRFDIHGKQRAAHAHEEHNHGPALHGKFIAPARDDCAENYRHNERNVDERCDKSAVHAKLLHADSGAVRLVKAADRPRARKSARRCR